jgi:GxxExxY protein
MGNVSPVYPNSAITERVIGAAIEVHRQLGPGFLESAYEEALCLELHERGVPFQQQVAVNVRYRGVVVARHRIDLIVEGLVVVELKAVRQIDDLHLAVALAYLRATGLTTGLILNFSEAALRIRRVIKNSHATSEALKN